MSMEFYLKKKTFLVPFLATREVVAPLANNPIMLDRSIQSFRHLELQNPSNISYFRHSACRGGFGGLKNT